MGYTGKSLIMLENEDVSIGDNLILRTDDIEYQGALIPRYEYSDDMHIVLKLESGYNIGVNVMKIKEIVKVSQGAKPQFSKSTRPIVDSSLPKVAIISTGGTIASRIDYRTGGVRAALTAEDLYFSVPELSQIAQIDCEVLHSLYSENIEIYQWRRIAEKIAEKKMAGYSGVIVAHGTDTMGYTSAALSFALINTNMPILLVGAQRSSDRPSSDSATNLIGAVRVASENVLSGVYVVMHDCTDDNVLAVHHGTKVRKNHTSRRDAFQSVNTYPVAHIRNGKTEYSLIRHKSDSESFRIRSNFEEKVHLLKFHPNSNPDLIKYLVDRGYKGLVIEGTGMGHVSDRWLEPINYAIEHDVLLCMASQCIWGRVSLTVYDTGRDLLSMGVIPMDDMLPETALVKIMWVLANSKDLTEAKVIMKKNIAGEFNPRSQKNGGGRDNTL